MQLTHLSLTNFRNFVRLETDFPGGLTILVGANAQGKTSLLEAIYFLAGAGSPHARSERELINFLALDEIPSVARITAELQRQDRLQRIELRLILDSPEPGGDPRLRKEVLLNGVKRRISDLPGEFNAVMFLPQDMRIIEGSPGERRRFLDSALTQADSVYPGTLSDYTKVLSQRNALLKQLQERGTDNEQLSFWDEQLAGLAANTIRARALAMRELETLAIPIHSELSRGKESLRLQYQPACEPAGRADGQLGLPMPTQTDWAGVSRETIRNDLLQALVDLRAEEIARGLTLLGPHRDDITFRANGLDLRLYGSRGQNRTAMLAIKLAEIEWMRQRTGEQPVLLLDEVLAELDVERRQDLIRRVETAHQAILTAADLAMFPDSTERQTTVWHIHAGSVRPKAPI
ncbi:MAG TPA: DNA replication/repair protein RecF [Anaerolineales bacterium]|nr:DNA replication/repair protein RecF [Anaerolineales bacterium]